MSDYSWPHDCSTPGLPVHHQLLEFIQTHVLWVGDIIQPSHPLSSPSPCAFNISQHQRLYQWVISTHQVLVASVSASVLSMNIQDWFPVELNGLIFLQSKGLSRVFSNTTVQKHQFFSTQLSLWSNSHLDLSLGFLPSGFPLYEVALFIYLLVCLLILSAWHAGSNSDPQKWKCRVLTTAPTGNSQGQL